MHIGFVFHQLPYSVLYREEFRENSKSSVLPKIEECWIKKYLHFLFSLQKFDIKIADTLPEIIQAYITDRNGSKFD
jgi:hypothetical protein